VNAASQSYPEAFWQLERDMENIWYKFQYRISDIGTTAKKNYIGLEASVKVTSKLSMFNRFSIETQPYSKRESEYIFSQLKYDIGSNAELFVEYSSDPKFFMKLSVWF